MTSHPDCKVLIPETFILCGEGGNYCSQECQDHVKYRTHVLMQVVKEREVWEMGKQEGVRVSIPLGSGSPFGDEGSFGVMGTKYGALFVVEDKQTKEPTITGLLMNDVRTVRDALTEILDEKVPPQNVLRAWAEWYSRKLDSGEGLSGAEQDLFEALGCTGVPKEG